MTFFEYCNSKKQEYLPLRGNFFGVNLLTSGNILIVKNQGGPLWIPENKILEIESELKSFLGNNGKFIYCNKKAKNIKTLLQII